MKFIFKIQFLLLLLTGVLPCRAQQGFLPNRLEYHKYNWKVLHTEAFRIYFPRGYDSLASLASVQLPDIIEATKLKMATSLQSMPQLILYPSPDQRYESNIGLTENEIQPFPTINLQGSRVLLSFNGSYAQFCDQLRTAWVRLTWEEQLQPGRGEAPGDRQEKWPPWCKEGMIGYLATGWSPEEETALYVYDRGRDTIPVAALEPALAPAGGKAFCYFLEQRYRADACLQLFFQLKQGKSWNRALRLVTRRNADTLLAECGRFYRERSRKAGLLPEVAYEPFTTVFTNTEADSLGYLPAYRCSVVHAATDTLRRFIEDRFKAGLLDLALTQDRQRIFFVLQQGRRRSVYSLSATQLRDARVKPKPFLTYRLPPWLQPSSLDPYPVLHWPDAEPSILAVIPEKGKLQLKVFGITGNPVVSRTLYGVDGVSSVLPYQGQYLLAASRRGRSDLVLFDPGRQRYAPLTRGQAEHIQPALSSSGGYTLLTYRSGYPADSLYYRDTAARRYGLYQKALYGPEVTARNPGYPLALDTAYIRWQRPFRSMPGMLSAYAAPGGLLVACSLPAAHRYTDTSQAAPWLEDLRRNLQRKDSVDALLARAAAGSGPSFLEGVLQPGGAGKAAALRRDSLRRAVAYTPGKVRPYLLQLYRAFFSAQINNDYYINRYQPFQAYLGTFKFPEVSAMAQGGFSDLFENHHINIGYRMPAGSEGSDFFVRYAHTARRLDWHVLFFRKVESLEPDADRGWTDNQGRPYPAAAKVKTHYYELGFHYPLHYDWSLDFSTAARRDRTIFLATDRYSLHYEALQGWWSISNLGLKVHKLRPGLPFLYRGLTAEALADGMAATGKRSTILYGLRLKGAWHQPLVRDINLVLRAQGGYSGGQSRILYAFGGTDNNVVPRLDTTVTFGQQAPYAFQSLVTPFRGYRQHSIYGGSFGLLNLDVYFPLFRSLIPLQTGFSALRNLQLGIFADMAATARVTGLPGVSSPQYAYGFSARTLLAGYPLRFDMGWPGDFGKQPVWYFSLCLQ